MFNLHGFGSKLLVLAGFCLLIGSAFSLLGMALVEAVFDLGVADIGELLDQPRNPENLQLLKFLQLFNSLGLFVLPPILFVMLFSYSPMKELSLNFLPKAFYFFMVLILFILALPLLNWLVEWNASLELPDALSGIENWMRESEESAMELTSALLKMDNFGDLMVNLLLIAVVPAVGEELLFRGLIQKYFANWFSNYHLGVWISAILFSALHLQFFGFFPRLMLGVLFGYFLVYTGSLWVPIFAHFVNNASALIASYIYGFNAMENEMDKIGASEDSIVLLIPSILLFIAGIYYFFRKAQADGLAKLQKQ